MHLRYPFKYNYFGYVSILIFKRTIPCLYPPTLNSTVFSFRVWDTCPSPQGHHDEVKDPNDHNDRQLFQSERWESHRRLSSPRKVSLEGPMMTYLEKSTNQLPSTKHETEITKTFLNENGHFTEKSDPGSIPSGIYGKIWLFTRVV